MMSSIITFPLAGSATIESDTTFNITVQMSNITPGFFSNADSTYFSAPQQLDANGVGSLINIPQNQTRKEISYSILHS